MEVKGRREGLFGYEKMFDHVDKNQKAMFRNSW